MAQHRVARLIKAEPFGAQAKLLSFSLPDGEIDFSGGQYIIVNTGIELPGGKIAKRAYSILSGDSEQREFQIAVRRIGDGPGSNFMHQLEEGSRITFSGPWGKFVSDRPAAGQRLVFATDTGITALLGLLRSGRSRLSAKNTTAVWFVEPGDYFLPPGFPRASLAGCCREFRVVDAPATGDSARLKEAFAIMAPIASPPFSEAFLVGDGAVVYSLRDHLIAVGLPRENIHLEAFFNNPERKSQS